MAKCTGIRCPMQVGYKVDECNFKDCSYRTEPITNADRIRAMSDDELALFIRAVIYAEDCPVIGSACNKCFIKEFCFNGSKWRGKEIEWLQQPVEGE